MKTTILVLSVFFGCFSALAKDARPENAKTNHYTMITAYTSAFPMAMLAEQTCPGVKVETSKLLQLRILAKISDAEEPMAEKAIKEAASNLRDGIAKNGTLSWCANVWSLIGEEGSVMPGLISRP